MLTISGNQLQFKPKFDRNTITQLEIEFDEFISSEEYHFCHGDIEDRAEECQWGARWFFEWLKQKETI